MTHRKKLIEVALPADATPRWSGRDTPCRSDPRAMGVKPYPRIVGAAEPLLPDPDRVVAGAVQEIAGLARQVLADLRASCDAAPVDLDDALARQPGGIGGRRPDVLDAKRRTAGDDLLRAQPGGEIVEHHGDRNPRPPDAGLAVADGGVRSRHSMAAVSMLASPWWKGVLRASAASTGRCSSVGVKGEERLRRPPEALVEADAPSLGVTR
jgi:hypothetical protein